MAAKVEALILMGFVVLGVLRIRDVPWTPERVVGAVLCVGGLVLWSVAKVQLGKSFSVRARAKRLVTRGVYSRIRNPIYLSGEIFFVGAALYIPSWKPLLLVAVTVPMQVVRAKKEAAVLREAFGEEYEAYRRGTWF
jgi:protein-S-isoprenylcysteine O-methyltransferase Ste14